VPVPESTAEMAWSAEPVNATRVLLVRVPDTASVPAPETATVPDVTVMVSATIALSNPKSPAPDLVSAIAETVPPVSVVAADALPIVSWLATTPSGRTVIAAAVLMMALSPA
jgi:hypothetical protein